MDVNICNLCSSEETEFYIKDKKREYYICNRCNIIFVPSKFHITSNEEKERYSLHTNSNSEQGYIDFLSRIIEPITNGKSPDSIGLDFGCGPGPILKDLFNKKNYKLEEYDLYFKNSESILRKKYDFIITTEVVEHLKEPLKEITMLWKMLKKGGLLAIMTNLHSKDIDFNSWYYKGDPTHISFFSKKTFLWLANKFIAKIDFIDKDIIILKKDYYI